MHICSAMRQQPGPALRLPARIVTAPAASAQRELLSRIPNAPAGAGATKLRSDGGRDDCVGQQAGSRRGPLHPTIFGHWRSLRLSGRVRGGGTIEGGRNKRHTPGHPNNQPSRGQDRYAHPEPLEMTQLDINSNTTMTTPHNTAQKQRGRNG